MQKTTYKRSRKAIKLVNNQWLRLRWSPLWGFWSEKRGACPSISGWLSRQLLVVGNYSA